MNVDNPKSLAPPPQLLGDECIPSPRSGGFREPCSGGTGELAARDLSTSPEEVLEDNQVGER